MDFAPLEIPGAFVVTALRRHDERGYFARLWCSETFRAKGIAPGIAQINTGFSPRAGTLRGMHYQRAPHGETKVVRCVHGELFDVLVDLRRDSPTFRKWYGLRLDPEDGRMLVVPEGCAHGYLTLRDDTELVYLTSAAYEPGAATGVRYDDPAFGIEWPAGIRIVSRADATWPDFET
ncbi:MAG: dTDP-4-dehydrorhamnose 3,5-epimerase family protein [Burkholderiaceae bacterium]|nr:dTDP-4-dehydrorhamnose 3,5-epimerase family protein [Burkholderiaceae bacterium]